MKFCSSVPKLLFYVNVRRRVANKLRRIRRESNRTGWRTSIRDKVREITGLDGATVQRDDDGNFVVSPNDGN